MNLLAHIGAVPVEEFLALAPALVGVLIAVRAKIHK